MNETDVILKVELANKIEGGRAVGNLYGVGKFASDGRRLGWFLQPQEDEQFARELAAEGAPAPPCWFCGGEGFHHLDCDALEMERSLRPSPYHASLPMPWED